MCAGPVRPEEQREGEMELVAVLIVGIAIGTVFSPWILAKADKHIMHKLLTRRINAKLAGKLPNGPRHARY
jgi:hypothetical protein